MDYLLILLGLVVLGVALAALTRGHLWWARTLQREHASEHDTLQAVTAAAVQAVPGAENATITLVVGRTKVQTRAATGARARRMDELQTELDDGPCLTTIWEQETVHIPDMATESRWLRFAAAAAEAGVGVGTVLCCAVLCFDCSSTATPSGPRTYTPRQRGRSPRTRKPSA